MQGEWQLWVPTPAFCLETLRAILDLQVNGRNVGRLQ